MSAPARLPLLLLGAALILSACVTTPPAAPPSPAPTQPAPAPSRPAPSRPSACTDCGTVMHIETVAAGKAQGALGGIVGSVASKPVAGDLDYKVHVRMDNGSRTAIVVEERGNLKVNSRVRVVNGRLVTR